PEVSDETPRRADGAGAGTRRTDVGARAKSSRAAAARPGDGDGDGAEQLRTGARGAAAGHRADPGAAVERGLDPDAFPQSSAAGAAGYRAGFRDAPQVPGSVAAGTRRRSRRAHEGSTAGVGPQHRGRSREHHAGRSVVLKTLKE